MLTTPLLALTFSLIPSLVTAAIFPSGTLVKMLDAKSFKKAMKANETSMVAFVAPWCGHCQRLAPEYSKAAQAFHPLVPVYAVDCDDEKNKRLCAEQGVQGFPTVKLFPRGNQIPPMTYGSGERTASALFYWASSRVPSPMKKLYNVEELQSWIETSASSPKPRALLLTKEKKVPLLWKVLANKFTDNIDFASHRNRKGKGSKALGYEDIEERSIVLIYSQGATKAVRYEGKMKLEPLTKYFDTIVDGTADLSIPEEPAVKEDTSEDADEIVIDSPATASEPELTPEEVEPEFEVVEESSTSEPEEPAPEQTVVEVVEEPSEKTESPEAVDEASSPEPAPEVIVEAETEQVVLDTPSEPRPVDEL
ncbi:uncharacterized protein EV420DRAFT_679894 [Desarmillaria tabescens]|uniref:Thioredoxin domain-containing protein n=1 Tax=Armillaria tabescens TaxID=1929756 RepID=A0AA39K3I5_ARMTA|nr:uncharacterized protein EV420DRAFT_679894 [Desarmillaria tabescens]KAK0452711.1 hypothetical protein EV420DRAFT_679894 [Desarmillaria tabescens]